MSLLYDVFGGAVNVAVASTVKPTLKSLCAKIPWSVDVDHGDGTYELHFNSSVYGTRKVIVNWGEKVASFALRSSAEFTSRSLFAELGYGLLLRNKEILLGAWDMREVNGGKIGFLVSYTALIAGLDAVFLKIICESLVEEAARVDGGLRSKGLI